MTMAVSAINRSYPWRWILIAALCAAIAGFSSWSACAQTKPCVQPWDGQHGALYTLILLAGGCCTLLAGPRRMAIPFAALALSQWAAWRVWANECSFVGDPQIVPEWLFFPAISTISCLPALGANLLFASIKRQTSRQLPAARS